MKKHTKEEWKAHFKECWPDFKESLGLDKETNPISERVEDLKVEQEAYNEFVKELKVETKNDLKEQMVISMVEGHFPPFAEGVMFQKDRGEKA